MTRILLAPIAALAALAFSSAASAQVQIYSNGSVVRPAPRPTGKITGTIVDENGAPVARVIVQALAEMVLRDGTRVPAGSSSSSTDENGRFTIDRVPAQPVLVAAVPPPRPFSRPGMAPPQTEEPVYAITYYPGVTTRDQAQPLTVAEGGEQAIFIELRRVQPFHVRGTISSGSGRSPAGLQIMLQQMFGSGGGTRNGSVVQQDGTFDIGSVSPGSYTITARVSMDENAEFAAQDIQVVDHDLDVALALGTGGSINGRIVFQGAAPGPAPLGVNVSLGPMPGQMMFGRPLGPAPVAEDWTFRLRGLYGTFRIGVPMALVGQYRPVRMDFDGRSIQLGNTGFPGIPVHDGEHELVIYLAPVTQR
jgi:hypothetical protein